MDNAIIIQARVGSTRFPNKMTIPFHNGKGMLHFLLSRMVKAGLPAPIILAIPDSPANDVLEEIGTQLNINVFRGSENDVLQRFIDAATLHKATRIIRVCADNPFLDTQSLINLIDTLKNDPSDYISYCLTDGTPTIKTHYGFWAEAVRLNALKTVAGLTDEKLYREHVTNYIYAHPKAFTRSCLRLDPAIEANPWARFTVDTAQDFENMKNLAADLPTSSTLSPIQLINHIANFPGIKTSMQAEINKNQK